MLVLEITSTPLGLIPPPPSPTNKDRRVTYPTLRYQHATDFLYPLEWTCIR